MSVYSVTQKIHVNALKTTREDSFHDIFLLFVFAFCTCLQWQCPTFHTISNVSISHKKASNVIT